MNAPEWAEYREDKYREIFKCRFEIINSSYDIPEHLKPKNLDLLTSDEVLFAYNKAVQYIKLKLLQASGINIINFDTMNHDQLVLLYDQTISNIKTAIDDRININFYQQLPNSTKNKSVDDLIENLSDKISFSIDRLLNLFPFASFADFIKSCNFVNHVVPMDEYYISLNCWSLIQIRFILFEIKNLGYNNLNVVDGHNIQYINDIYRNTFKYIISTILPPDIMNLLDDPNIINRTIPEKFKVFLSTYYNLPSDRFYNPFW